MSPQPIANAGIPLSNVDGKYVNVTGSTYSGNFNSTSAANHQYGMSGISSNVAAANASKGGSRVGGSRKRRKIGQYFNINFLRKKIKNISNKYKMPKSGKNKMVIFRNMKRKMSNMFSLKNHNKSHKNKTCRHFSSKGKSKSKSKKQRGGYHQYQSNIPNTPSYSTGGHVTPSMSALANPVPYKHISNCTNCVDNYNHNTNKGFQFW